MSYDIPIDISPNNDGGIIKTIKRNGNINNGKVYPLDSVEIAWKIFHLNGSLIHQSNKSAEPFNYMVNSNPRQVILGWEYGVLTMFENEIASFKISSHYAFGSKGALPLIPPNTDIITAIELLNIIPNLKRQYRTVGYNESIRDELMENIRTGKSSIAQEVMENKIINETKSIENLKFFDPKIHKIDPNQVVKGENKDFVWVETPKTIEAEFKLPTQMSKQDLLVDIKATTVRIVVLSTGETIVDSKWHGKIIPSESSWCILDPEMNSWYRGYRLLLTMEKAHDSKDIWADLIDSPIKDEVFTDK